MVDWVGKAFRLHAALVLRNINRPALCFAMLLSQSHPLTVCTEVRLQIALLKTRKAREYNFPGMHRRSRNCDDLFAGSESVIPAEADVFLGSLVLFAFAAVVIAPILADLVTFQCSRSVERKVPSVRSHARMH